MTPGWLTRLRDPREPLRVRPLTATTPRRLVLRTIVAVPAHATAAAALLVVNQLGEVAVPVLAGLAVDQAVRTGDGGRLVWWTALLALTFLVLIAARWLGTRLGRLCMESVRFRLRSLVLERVLRPDGLGGPPRSAGDLLSVATSDVGRLARAVMIGLYPAAELAALLFCAVVLITVSVPLGVAVLVGAPTLLFALDRAAGPLRRSEFRMQELVGATTGRAEDVVSGARVLRGVGGEAVASRWYVRSSRRTLTATLVAKAAEGRYVGVMSSAGGLFVVGVGTAAGWLAVTGAIGVGELIIVVGLTQLMLSPLEALAFNLGAAWSAALASADRLLDVLTTPPVVARGSARLPDGAAASLEFHGVRGTAVAGFTLAVPPGECVAVVGGARALAELAAFADGRAEPGAGRVAAGGVPVLDLDPAAAREFLLVAPQVPDLFGETVAGEVTGGAAAAVLASGGYADLPGDRTTGEGGRELSGGQRQRVALARALAEDRPVLVLHDPTTAVDSVTEAALADGLRRVRRDRTTLLLCSSPALLAVADRVVTVPEVRPAAEDGPA